MRLDLSIGPVQGFVAQSRRTRDLWGSSWLLSFLAAHAMRGTEQAGGTIIQPCVRNDLLYRWVTDRNRADEAPRLGTVPNHFVVEVEGNARAVAEAGIRALDTAWMRVCRAVWERFVAPVCPHGNGTEAIWQRQVSGFWEIMWTAANTEAPSGLLTRRKHWRSHHPPDEPGDKCTVMHDLQELSGYVSAQGREARQGQERFWCQVRSRAGPLDLRDNEHLCAVAMVKRLFPKVAAEALGVPLDTSHWPSTVYIGAVPWIRRAASTAPEPARRYAEAVRRHGPEGVLAEPHPPFAGLDDPAAGDFPKLDANYYHRDFVRSERLCPLSDAATDTAAETARDEIVRRLKALHDEEDEDGRPLGAPPSFYVLLLADGDRLGRLVATSQGGGRYVGEALSAFTTQVPQIVRDHDGVTVYAGGDDVLAMLPMPEALACATKLAGAYRSAFANGDGAAPEGATLSAAVVFAHIRLPLSAVIAEAHRLLNGVAKDANGRNSLAVGVLKGSGRYCQWVTTWERSGTDGQSVAAQALLHNLMEHLRGAEATPGLSSSLIYRVRDLFGRLCGWSRWAPGRWDAVPQGVDIRALLRAEILQGWTKRWDQGPETEAEKSADAGRLAAADELSCLIVELLAPARATAAQDDEAIMATLKPCPAGPSTVTTAADNAAGKEAGLDALLLARFLSDPARDEEERP